MVTVLLLRPPAEMTSGTAVPGVTSAGTSALICHRPTQPGRHPAEQHSGVLAADAHGGLNLGEDERVAAGRCRLTRQQ